jgi:hypothetical protein
MKAISKAVRGELPPSVNLFIGAVKCDNYRALNSPICFPWTSHPMEDES